MSWSGLVVAIFPFLLGCAFALGHVVGHRMGRTLGHIETVEAFEEVEEPDTPNLEDPERFEDEEDLDRFDLDAFDPFRGGSS